MRRRWRLLGVLLLAGCEATWDAGNRGGLARAVAAVTGLPEGQLDCRMIGTTRSGYCVVPLSPDQAAALVARLGLRDADWAPAEGCRAAGFENARARGLRDRATALRPGGLEDLLLFVGPQAACLQATHAYG